ncbi:hypothetical protein M441DRAFT_348314 [Trichoderma asperellum CBS 433.97]|uniref:Uncharacterized protein n=1 Tax=Trichoderma asperellum (strain ATCC 204424 / CBS 433.97 / NBRC 101777) TaxID=1042311 RepID=A0A2T3ZHX9_TRIA4|nr:hypothetical protein M441DRAFT_348314 [Trichoderma asperellum CBS 433.97]PTB44410.1 hypothetical protein M441DRAFT_348314 [Trichoderma asperellum CBS 433.97]
MERMPLSAGQPSLEYGTGISRSLYSSSPFFSLYPNKMYLLMYLTGAYIYYNCFFLFFFCQEVLRRGSSIKAKRLQRERVSLHGG